MTYFLKNRNTYSRNRTKEAYDRSDSQQMQAQPKVKLSRPGKLEVGRAINAVKSTYYTHIHTYIHTYFNIYDMYVYV